MSKRIVTLDALRGLSIFVMIFFHAFFNSAAFFSNLDDVFGNIVTATIGIIVFIFGHFRGFFIFISGASNVYAMTQAAKKGKPINKIMGRNVAVGAILVAAGHIKDTFFNQSGFFRYLTVDSQEAGWNAAENFYEWANLGYLSEAVQSIGWCLLLTSIIYCILLKTKVTEKKGPTIIILVLCAIFFIYMTPVIQDLFTLAGLPEVWDINRPQNIDKNTFLRLTLWLWYDIAGAQSPIFPMMGYSIVGGIVGYMLTQPNLDKKFAVKGVFSGFLLILIGGVDAVLQIFVFETFEFLTNYKVHPSWFMLVILGIQMMILFITLNMFEFNKKMTPKKAVKATGYIRRWGYFGLTVYMLQVLEYIPRTILFLIFPQSNLQESQGAAGIWLFVFLLSNYLMWELIIFVSIKLKGKNTLEYLLLKIAKRGKITNKDDPLAIESNLKNVEPILFLQETRTQQAEVPE